MSDAATVFRDYVAHLTTITDTQRATLCELAAAYGCALAGAYQERRAKRASDGSYRIVPLPRSAAVKGRRRSGGPRRRLEVDEFLVELDAIEVAGFLAELDAIAGEERTP